jgi:hypothetical protein
MNSDKEFKFYSSVFGPVDNNRFSRAEVEGFPNKSVVKSQQRLIAN